MKEVQENSNDLSALQKEIEVVKNKAYFKEKENVDYRR
jgi:hypothetical protein